MLIKHENTHLNRLIIFEGTCCVGKTAIIREMQMNNKFLFVPENLSQVDYPIKSVTDRKEALRRDLYFLSLDIKKGKEILSLSNQQDIIVERCFLGTLAITYSNSAFNSNLSLMIRYLLKNIDINRLIVPDVFVYITKDKLLLEEHLRLDKNNKRINQWNNINSFIKQDEFLREYFLFQTAVPLFQIKNEGNPRIVAKHIEDYLESSSMTLDLQKKRKFYEELTTFLKMYI